MFSLFGFYYTNTISRPIIVVPIIVHSSSNKMLSYRRETALQGAL